MPIAIKPASAYRRIREYPIILDGADIRRVSGLHNLVGRFRGHLLTDRALQNVLMDGGYEMDEARRPKTYFNLLDHCINRTKVMLPLEMVDMMIDLVTAPPVVALEPKRAVVHPDKFSFVSGYCEEDRKRRTITAHGLDAEKVEELQVEWIRNEKVRRLVENYKDKLSAAFDEFNMKHVLNRIAQAADDHLPDFVGRSDEIRHHTTIQKVFEPRAYNVLDNAYYGMANRFMHQVAQPWEELMDDKFGRFFVLDSDEINEGMQRVMLG